MSIFVKLFCEEGKILFQLSNRNLRSHFLYLYINFGHKWELGFGERLIFLDIVFLWNRNIVNPCLQVAIDLFLVFDCLD